MFHSHPPRFIFAIATIAVLSTVTACKKSSSDDDAPLAAPSPFLSFVVEPTSTEPNTAIAPSIVVALRDGSGTLVSTATDTVTLSIQSNPGGATLGGTVSRAAVGGQATFNDITLTSAANNYTLRAACPGYLNATSAAFNVQSNAATQLVITTAPPATVAPHATFTVAVEARNVSNAVDTAFNGPVTIAFGATPGDLLLHASGLGDPILEFINTTTPAVTGSLTPTFAMTEALGMVYDPAIELVRVTDLDGNFTLLDPSTGDCAMYGGTFSLSNGFKGIAFNGQGEIRALSPFDTAVSSIDLTTGVDSPTGASLTYAGGNIFGCNGLARHPTSGVFYAVVAEDSGNFAGRPLVTVNMGTGVCTVVGDTSDFVAGLTFTPDGTLYAVTGDGAGTPETLWTVNIATGAMTNILTLGNGNDGETLTYVPRRLRGTLTVNAVNGVATFPGLSIDQLGSGYTLTISSGGLASATTAAINVTGSVTPTATVSFSAASSSVAENVGGGLATVTLELSAVQTHDVPVMLYIDVFGTALVVEDFDQPLAFQVTIPAGETQVSFDIPIVDDGNVESDEDVVIVLSGAALSAGFGANSIHTLTITNDD
jgi:hypothetical protein